GKDRTDHAKPLHTNFKLNHDGEYLGLADGNTNIISEFAPTFPPQQPDISYGRDRVDPGIVGYFTNATPGSANSTTGPGFVSEPIFSLASGVYTNDSLLLTISNTDGATI